ncbi:MAG: glycosyltransferase family 2 protein [Burkholderiaceae bacterium]|nr:glycosyltransferase family 2 protein [Burkholderiaceae bacterium]
MLPTNVSNSAPKVCVVIVNWNGGEFLQQCIADLAKQTYQAHEIILLDNASSDGSAEKACTAFPQVRLVHAGSNLGFAAGNNLAVKLANPECEWIALLNPDAFPDVNWLKCLVEAAVAKPNYAIFGSRLVDATDRTRLDGTGDVYHMSGLVWRENHGKKISAAMLEAREIFTCCAAAGLYRRDVFEQLGGFDEHYFCYLEDIDLGFRYRLRGHGAWYAADSIAYHVGSALTGKRSDFSIYYGHRNLVWTFVKNMPGYLFFVLLPLHIALNIFTLFYFALRGQGKTIWRAKVDAIKELPRVWQQRKLEQTFRTVTPLDIWRVLSKKWPRK